MNAAQKDLGSELTFYPVEERMRPVTDRLAVGSSDALVEQLVTKSREPAILEYTPKDASERFADPKSFRVWLSKGREVHWLLNAENDLAGIMWYGKSAFPLDTSLDEVPDETCAIRMYEGYAGHGLARPFMRLSLRIYLERKQQRGEQCRGIWLQTDADDPAGLAVYTKFGYQEVGRSVNRVTMVLPAREAAAIVKE